MLPRTVNQRWAIPILVSGIGISSIGDFIYLVAINVFILERTHTAAAVAGIWVVARVAALVVGPWAGSVTDRVPLRGQLAAIEGCRAVLLGVLPLLTQLGAIYADLFLLGAFSTCFQNAFLPYQTALIPASSQKRVNSITSTLQYSAFLTGPAIAGALLLHNHASVPLWLDALSFLGSAMSFFLLPSVGHNQRDAAASTKHKLSWRVIRSDFREAAAFLYEHRVFLTVYVFRVLLTVFALTADSQEVVFAQKALHLGQFGYGMMVTAAGVGFVSGSVLLTFFAKRVRTYHLIGIGGLLSAAGYACYAFAHNFWTAVAGLVILGIFGSGANVGWTTYQQRTVPVSIMGRLNNVVGPPQQVLGIAFLLLGGVIATQFGVRALMIGMTIPMCLAAAAILCVLPQQSRDAQGVTRTKHTHSQ
ncbi:MFS transporter [Alicyclobacillus cycloheptanicus]|uniref:MFS family permease n=1 Tax=Alicyclobacillus cycloheptanicus TaxID=1457 RepID=A0ABT9XDY7_9BACL|nr:MFS transporter [Alicyclobacillus cycloheptanicus]MDQ0188514.1 MFS family permease [Alicyclobacillus cycloheptanicus]WDM01201.1 MFS transporter [Alicyclobacillus cycloheptanicus]